MKAPSSLITSRSVAKELPGAAAVRPAIPTSSWNPPVLAMSQCAIPFGPQADQAPAGQGRLFLAALDLVAHRYPAAAQGREQLRERPGLLEEGLELAVREVGCSAWGGSCCGHEVPPRGRASELLRAQGIPAAACRGCARCTERRLTGRARQWLGAPTTGPAVVPCGLQARRVCLASQAAAVRDYGRCRAPWTRSASSSRNLASTSCRFT